jgi:hypothetical protein
MADASKQTANFKFQKIGGSQELEVADHNAMLDILDSQLPAPVDLASVFTAGVGVAVGAPLGSQGIQRVRLTLTAAVVAATNAHKYGSLLLLTWPNANIKLVRARMNLTGTKDGAQIQAADQPTVALGSAAASNTTLATTMIDTADTVTMAATAAAVVQKNGNATQADRQIAAGATNYVYLNIGATGNTGGGDGSVAFTGTIDLFYVNLGTFS